MPLEPAEQVRIRAHLGYPMVTEVASLMGGTPRMMETRFLVENQIASIPDGAALDRVRMFLGRLDQLEADIFAARKRLKVTRMGSTELRSDEIFQLRQEYYLHAKDLADQISAPIYPYAEKFKGFTSRHSLSRPVAGI